jgi:hypothetical protein
LKILIEKIQIIIWHKIKTKKTKQQADEENGKEIK